MSLFLIHMYRDIDIYFSFQRSVPKEDEIQWRHWNVSAGFWDFVRGGRQRAAEKTSYRFSTMDSYGGGAYLLALRGGPASLTGSARVRPPPSTLHAGMDGHVSSRNPRFTPARALFSCSHHHWREVWMRTFIVSFAGCAVTEQLERKYRWK